MSKSQRLQIILDEAKAEEKKYNWAEAAELFEQALRAVGKKDFLKKGEVQERIGYCFYRAAFQGETQEEFKQRMRQAIKAYEKTHGFCEKLVDEQKAARMFRCDAMIAYLRCHLTSEVSERKRLLGECCRMTKESLGTFEKTGATLEYGKTYNLLSAGVLFGFFLEWNYHAREKTIKEALKHGKLAIAFLSTFMGPELIRTYIRTAACLSTFAYYFLDAKEEAYQKVKDHLLKANEISEETAFIELLSVAGLTSWSPWTEGSDEALRNLEKALDYARKTRDKFIVGSALELLAYHTFWRARAIEDPDEGIRLCKTALHYAEEAQHQFSPISFTSVCKGILWVEAPHADYYFRLAHIETNLDKKRGLLEKGVEASRELIRRAQDSGCPENVIYANHVFRLILIMLAEMEGNTEEKRSLLEKALMHANECLRLTEQIETHNYWDLGIMHGGVGWARYDLADLVKDTETKKNMIQEAVLDLETAEKLLIKGLAFFKGEAREPVSQLAVLGWLQYGLGVRLNRLYELTNNKKHLRKAAKVLAEAAAAYQKINVKSRTAESLWRAAQVYDDLGEHLKAAQNFDRASSNYKGAAEKILQLKEFYKDHALYMQAWSEIEKARHNHTQRHYGQAREHYEKAANLHKSTERWKHLTSDYLALARLEEAEDLSRAEKTEEAKDLFQQAVELFLEAKKTIKAKLERIESKDEEELAVNLAEASDVRREYCLGRIALEEAKILDRQGDHAASSKKYALATEKFERAMDAMKSESDRQELRPTVYLSRAWQTMTRAEAEASPELYLEASKLFDEAKEHSLDENAKMLALGHSRFCKALEAGTRFEDTRKPTFHSAATQHLESASSYYLKAGFKSASEYAKATQRLLDAYLYLDKAKKETEPRKRTQLYRMAEKTFQASSGSYMQAKHPEKSEQVKRLLENVKEERQLAMSLTEVLHAPAITSTTASFPTPTAAHEQAVGLERFEHADIQANLILRVRDVKVGEDIDFEIELINAGKAPALLIKVEKVVPEGFEVKEVPEVYRVEDRFLNLKGKRLNPLKTEEVKIVVKPLSKGTFILKPRIRYLDETGKYKSHEPEPVTITVKELGIKGWIKGER